MAIADKTGGVFSLYLMRTDSPAVKTEFSSPRRMEELSRVTNGEVLRSKRATWTLLETAMNHAFGISPSDVDLEKTENGKWECDAFCFSLSHSGKYAAAAVSDLPVGVDIEEISAFEKKYPPHRRERIKSKILSSNESRDEPLISLWTKKESIYKCLGTDGFSPKDTDTSKFPTLSRTLFGEVFISLYRTSPGKVRIFTVNGGGITEVPFL